MFPGCEKLTHHPIHRIARTAKSAHSPSLPESLQPGYATFLGPRLLLDYLRGIASPRMSPHETDRRHLERQIVHARPIVVLLSILALLQQPDPQASKRSISFLVAYVILSLVVIP